MARDVVKKNQSSLQVLKTLNVLLEGNYTMQELVQKLNSKEKDPIFNNSVVSKYINTCRYCGIKILKVNNRYFLVSMPFGIDLSEKDLELFKKLQEMTNTTFSAKQNKKIELLIEKISKYSNKYIPRVEEKIVNISFDLFEKAISEYKKIFILLKNKTALECTPLCIVTKEKKVFFNVLVNGKEKLIPVKKVLSIEYSKTNFIPSLSERTAIYKLFGGLAKRYTLRENEKILMNNLPESITISNVSESKEVLISRLMRYGNLCKIESPIEYKEAMINMIEKTLANYGE